MARKVWGKHCKVSSVLWSGTGAYTAKQRQGRVHRGAAARATLRIWHTIVPLPSCLPLSPAPRAGYIFTPQRFARDNLSHPPHVMSDHILLASAVHGGLASEALLPLLNWRHAQRTGGHCRALPLCAVACKLGGMQAAGVSVVGETAVVTAKGLREATWMPACLPPTHAPLPPPPPRRPGPRLSASLHRRGGCAGAPGVSRVLLHCSLLPPTRRNHPGSGAGPGSVPGAAAVVRSTHVCGAPCTTGQRLNSSGRNSSSWRRGSRALQVNCGCPARAA